MMDNEDVVLTKEDIKKVVNEAIAEQMKVFNDRLDTLTNAVKPEEKKEKDKPASLTIDDLFE